MWGEIHNIADITKLYEIVSKMLKETRKDRMLREEKMGDVFGY